MDPHNEFLKGLIDIAVRRPVMELGRPVSKELDAQKMEVVEDFEAAFFTRKGQPSLLELSVDEIPGSFGFFFGFRQNEDVVVVAETAISLFFRRAIDRSEINRGEKQGKTGR